MTPAEVLADLREIRRCIDSFNSSQALRLLENLIRRLEGGTVPKKAAPKPSTAKPKSVGKGKKGR
jgi:hypothetical protein